MRGAGRPPLSPRSATRKVRQSSENGAFPPRCVDVVDTATSSSGGEGDRGLAMVAAQPLRGGTVLYEEMPLVVVASSTAALGEKHGNIPFHCTCGHCLAHVWCKARVPPHFPDPLAAETSRLVDLGQSEPTATAELATSELVSTISAHAALARKVRQQTGDDYSGQYSSFFSRTADSQSSESAASGVACPCGQCNTVFCSANCVAASRRHHPPALCVFLAAVGGTDSFLRNKNGPLNKFTLQERKARIAQLALEPSDLDAIGTYGDVACLLADVIALYNQRVWMIVKLLCAMWAAAQGQGPGGSVGTVFHEATDSASTIYNDFLEHFTEGRPRVLAVEQRHLLRLVARLLPMCFPDMFVPNQYDDKEDFEITRDSTHVKLPVPTLQQLYGMINVMDANAHTTIVVHPLYDVLVKQRATSRLIASRSGHCHANPSGSTEPPSAADLVEGIFRRCPAEALPLVHNYGVALFVLSSKMNHSCVPNCRLVPTAAPVRARVQVHTVHRGRPAGMVSVGQELCISYLDEVELADSVGARQLYLMDHYGFECDCTLCREQLALGES